MNLLERLAHFEKHQLEEGDEYGAEVLHHASTALRLLVEVGRAGLELVDVLSDDAYKIDSFTLQPLENAIRAALANPDCAALLGGVDEKQ